VSEPYNPLSKLNLARSIEGEVLSRELQPLRTLGSFPGAGIYLLYYGGALQMYEPLRRSLSTSNPRPIYVGKAIPEGGRIGGLTSSETKTTALAGRLRSHARSISKTENLELDDFLARFLVVDDGWIPLGENMLIETYRPVWNRVVSGFGNNPLGAGRINQRVSLWDILHPGRVANVDAGAQVATQSELEQRVTGYLAGHDVPEAEEEEE